MIEKIYYFIIISNNLSISLKIKNNQNRHLHYKQINLLGIASLKVCPNRQNEINPNH